jgi:hypothetical protein
VPVSRELIALYLVGFTDRIASDETAELETDLATLDELAVEHFFNESTTQDNILRRFSGKA